MLSAYQLKMFNDLRAKVRDETVTVVTVTKTGTAGNPYGEGKTVTETTVSILGKVGWGSVFEKDDTAGGFNEIGDAKIVVAFEDMSKVNKENVYLRTADGSELAIIKIIPAALTQEVLIVCRKK